MLNLINDELKMFARARNVDCYKNVCRQQLQNIFAAPTVPKPTPIPAPKLEKCMPAPVLRPKKRTPTALYIMNLKKLNCKKQSIIKKYLI